MSPESVDGRDAQEELGKIRHARKLYPSIGVRVRQRVSGGIDKGIGMSKAGQDANRTIGRKVG